MPEDNTKNPHVEVTDDGGVKATAGPVTATADANAVQGAVGKATEIAKEIGSEVGEAIGGSQLGEALGNMAAEKVNQFLGGIFGQQAASALGAINEMVFGRPDPQLAFQYLLEIDGVASAGFKECNGIEWEMEVKNIRSGGNNLYEHHLLGPAKFKPLEVKRGFMASNGEFYTWLKKCLNSETTEGIRTSVSIVIYTDGMQEAGRFNFYNAFISKWTGPSLDAGSTEIAFESATIVYDWFEWLPGGAIAEAAKKAGGAAAAAGRSISIDIGGIFSI